MAILSDYQVEEYLALSDSLGLSALVEAHDEEEIRRAVKAGARIIGVNNRNLKDFSVDVNNCISLRNSIPNGILTVAESGIRGEDEVASIKNAKIDAVLIGETLMRSENREKTIKKLRGE